MIATYQKHICANEFITRHYSGFFLWQKATFLPYVYWKIMYLMENEGQVDNQKPVSKMTKWSVVAAKLNTIFTTVDYSVV